MELTPDNLRELSEFDSVQEMDKTIYKYIERLEADECAKSVIEVLRYLGRSSLMYPGVSWKKQDTIVKEVGVSLSTVNRALNTLEEYGMIRKIPTQSKWKTKQGGRSRRKNVNVIVIKPFNDEMKKQNEKTIETIETSNDEGSEKVSQSKPIPVNHSIKHIYVLDHNKERAKEMAEEKMKADASRNNIPKPIYNALRPFFNDKDLYKFVGIIFRAKTRKIRIERHVEEFESCIADCIRRYKKGVVRNLEAYMYKSIRTLSRKLFIEAI